MTELADFLSGHVKTDGRVVLDRTGLTGDFDFKSDWTRASGNGIPPDARFPTCSPHCASIWVAVDAE